MAGVGAKRPFVNLRISGKCPTADLQLAGWQDQALLTSRCANEMINNARALIYELLTAHPDITARDFLPHPG
jgi:hypothetical protein